MAVNMMVCRCLPGLFGPNSAPAPIWGDHETLSSLAHTLNTGLVISEPTSTTGQSEAAHAMQTAVTRLQKAGRIPPDLSKVQDLSDDQRVALGFESRALAAASSMQHWGVPPFKELNLSAFLAALRFVAHYSELKSGFKPVFQVGILTLIVRGVEPQFFAQLVVADAGVITDTVWLYRWCVMSGNSNDEYAEHWRAFDDSAIAQQQGSTSPQGHSAPSRTPASICHTPIIAITSPSPEEAKLVPPPLLPLPEPALLAPPPPSKQQTHRRTRRPKPPRPEFQHTHLSDSQLFALDPSLIQGSVLLRLAQSHSNQEIYRRINANHPHHHHEPGADGQQQQQGVRSVNVITKRLTHAIRCASKASGRSEREIRAHIAEAKRARGVVHKGKVDVTPYG